MTLTLTPEDQAFVDEVRAFIRAELPEGLRRKVQNEQWVTKAEQLEWEHRLAAKGWLAYTWPVEDGGPGWAPYRQFLFWLTMGEEFCPPITPFGSKMVGPLIRRFGTEAQKAQHLPGILNSTVWWCQGYSEPGAGSDLAALSTRAERRGDVYVVNGSKIWTSGAHLADWMFALVRTTREERKQQGISFLLIDMTTPGIRVQPIISIDGHHGFNQVFFDDVEVPVANRIGDEGKGWTYAKYLLGHERLDITYFDTSRRLMTRLMRAARQVETEEDEPLPAAFRLKIADTELRLRALEGQVRSAIRTLADGGSPGPEVSALKIRGTEVFQDCLEHLMELGAMQSLPYDCAVLGGAPVEDYIGPSYAATAASRYFSRRAMSILGGSNEIQRNILAKHVLGL
ncbi:MAG: acyl-CoA dehydrogenase family protein [Pseudooceanicola sp.]